MIRALRVALAYRQRTLAEWDIAYWRSARDTAAAQLAKAERRLRLLEAAPNDIRYPVPNVLRRGKT